MEHFDPAASRNDPEVARAIVDLATDHWYEVDHHWGRNAHRLYVEDGVYGIGDKMMRGHAEIRAFYHWREGRGERVARHVITNLRVRTVQARRARLDCIMNLYAADGVPVLPSQPAIMIADIVAECVQDDSGQWRFVSHFLKPLFVGGVPATVPPDH